MISLNETSPEPVRFVGLGARFLYASFDAWIADGAARYVRAVDERSGRSPASA